MATQAGSGESGLNSGPLVPMQLLPLCLYSTPLACPFSTSSLRGRLLSFQTVTPQNRKLQGRASKTCPSPLPALPEAWAHCCPLFHQQCLRWVRPQPPRPDFPSGSDTETLGSSQAESGRNITLGFPQMPLRALSQLWPPENSHSSTGNSSSYLCCNHVELTEKGGNGPAKVGAPITPSSHAR